MLHVPLICVLITRSFRIVYLIMSSSKSQNRKRPVEDKGGGRELEIVEYTGHETGG